MLVTPDDARWKDALKILRHDVYHLPEYVGLCAESEQATPCAFLAQEGDARFLVPLLLREIPDAGLRDALSPYGYPGPLVRGPAGFAERSVRAFMQELHQAGVVSAFVRLHTILDQPIDVLETYGKVVAHGPTVSIDLTKDDEAIIEAIDRRHRYEIDRAIKRGASAEWDPSWRQLPTFIRSYRETMARVGATAQYLFPDEYFSHLRDRLGKNVHLFVAWSGGRVAGGSLFFENDGLVQYHLSGTLDEHMPSNPAKLILREAAIWARSRGNRVLHLGGGVGGQEDSLFHFKAGFSPVRHLFKTWRAVCDASAYLRLTEKWKETHASTSGPPTDFFPKYRA